jgi:hypothetical protein
MRANQRRLYLSAMAYVLMSGLRRLGLKATELAQARGSTIRTKLLKIGAQIRVTVCKVLGFDGVQLSMARTLPAGMGEPALLESSAQANAILEVKSSTAGPAEPRVKSKTG